MIKQRLHSNPVPDEVGAQIDAPIISGTHARKERHVFAHHGEVVARIVEVEDALVRIIFVFIIVFAFVFWKQIHADTRSVDMCFGIFRKRRDAIHRLVLRVHFCRGYGRVPYTNNCLAPKDAQAVEAGRNGNIRQQRWIVFHLAVEKHRLVIHGSLHVLLMMSRPKRLAHDFGTKRELRIAIRVCVVHVAKRVQAVAHEGVKPVGVARNAFQNGVNRERHGVVHVNHD